MLCTFFSVVPANCNNQPTIPVTAQKATIHQTSHFYPGISKNVLCPGHNHLLHTSTDDPTLWLSPKWLAWWIVVFFVRCQCLPCCISTLLCTALSIASGTIVIKLITPKLVVTMAAVIITQATDHDNNRLHAYDKHNEGPVQNRPSFLEMCGYSEHWKNHISVIVAAAITQAIGQSRTLISVVRTSASGTWNALSWSRSWFQTLVW